MDLKLHLKSRSILIWNAILLQKCEYNVFVCVLCQLYTLLCIRIHLLKTVNNIDAYLHQSFSKIYPGKLANDFCQLTKRQHFIWGEEWRNLQSNCLDIVVIHSLEMAYKISIDLLCIHHGWVGKASIWLQNWGHTSHSNKSISGSLN